MTNKFLYMTKFILIISFVVLIVLLFTYYNKIKWPNEVHTLNTNPTSSLEKRIEILIPYLYGIDSSGHFVTDTQLVHNAFDEIVDIGEPAIPYLIEAMKHEDGGACGTVASVLSQMGEPGFMVLLRAAENKFRPLTETVRKLGKKNDVRAVPVLRNILNDTSISFDSRSEAAIALSMLGDTTAVLALLEMLENKENIFYRVARHNVIIALGKIRDKRAVNKLIEVMQYDEDDSIRRFAAEALGLIGDMSALTALEKALDDKDKYVRAAAAWSLKKITGKDYPYRNPPESYEPIYQCK